MFSCCKLEWSWGDSALPVNYALDMVLCMQRAVQMSFIYLRYYAKSPTTWHLCFTPCHKATVSSDKWVLEFEADQTLFKNGWFWTTAAVCRQLTTSLPHGGDRFLDAGYISVHNNGDNSPAGQLKLSRHKIKYIDGIIFYRKFVLQYLRLRVRWRMRRKEMVKWVLFDLFSA